MSNTITLPDPKNGTLVELEMPEGCLFFKHIDKQQYWRGWLKLEELCQYENERQICAAVAVCWWEAMADKIQTREDALFDRARKAADAWRKFTAQPEGM